MRKLAVFLLALTSVILVSAWLAPARAQTTNATVVSSCNSAAYSAGQNRPITQDTGGRQCGNASASLTTQALTSSNLASSVAVTNTFQSIQVATAGRQGCLIQNQSTTNAMWVYFGSIGGATKAKSFILDSAHGLAISCAVGGLGVATDQVSITGTATDLFNASFQ